MYARGVLGLFESLRKAAYVFEDRFWGMVIESLSSPVASEHTRNKVRSNLERMGADVLGSSSGVDSIVDLVIDAAGRIERPTHYVKFDALVDQYLSFVNKLEGDEKIQELVRFDCQLTDLSDEKKIREMVRAHLRDMLSALTARKLFLPGAEIQCKNCLASLWYHVDDLRSVVTCRGCRKEVSLPAEVRWSYALNELVVSAVRDHGVSPVIRTAFRLFKDSRDCFCFLPGVEIRDFHADPETQICELDLVWIRDGEFGIAEIKRNTKGFVSGKRLAASLQGALPDRYLLVSTTSDAEELEAARLDIQSNLKGRVVVEAWGPEIFASSSHPGWNTSIHLLFP